MSRKRPAIFLDRDGTVLNERGYLSDPKRIRFYKSSWAGLKRLAKLKLPIVIVSNQSGVARGYFSAATLEKINRAFTKRVAGHGVRIAGIFCCPHLPDAGCRCRKPRPGLVEAAARRLKIDLKASFVVGDQWRDVQLAEGVGATGILVLTGAGRDHRKTAVKSGAPVVRHLDAASRLIEKKLKARQP